MAGILDAPLRGAADTLLATFGSAGTIRRTESQYDPQSGTTVETTTDHPVSARVDSYPAQMQSAGGTETGSVQRGDRKVTLAAADLPVVPSTSDTWIMDNEEWSVVAVDPVRATDEPAIYVMQVRR